MTLKDFKAAIDREGNHRYHFKALDPEFGTVKEEVQDPRGVWVVLLVVLELYRFLLKIWYPEILVFPNQGSGVSQCLKPVDFFRPRSFREWPKKLIASLVHGLNHSGQT